MPTASLGFQTTIETSQGTSRLPEVKDLDLWNLLDKRELLNSTSGSFDAP